MTRRQLIIIAHDVAMTAIALLVSFFLRWGEAEFLGRLDRIAVVCALTVPLAALAYWFVGLHRLPWRFVSMPDLTRIAIAVTVPAVFLVVVDFIARGQVIVPRTVPAIYWLVQLALLAGPRVLYRAHRSRRRDRRAFKDTYRMPVLIAGVGDQTEQLVRRLRRDEVSALEPVGLLTPKDRYLGNTIQGVRIIGGFTDLDDTLRRLEARGRKPRRLILTREVLESDGVDALVASARRLGLATVRVSEAMTQVGDPDAAVKLAPVAIEDLLGRSAREVDLSSVRALVGGRRVLVTGAGGSIGSELCRQILDMGPAALVLLDHSELALWSIAKELRSRDATADIRQHLGSVCDVRDLAEAFAALKPELVFHAAALKHVDLVEAHPVAAAATNTLGTREVARLAREAGAVCAVFISTDKAVDPVSVLGATKRAGELVFAAADRAGRAAGDATRFLSVRFGNVLGSSGSVIPLFTEQLRAGGPITVTHPDVERYFMTIREAVTLVLMASAEGARSEEISPVYVLDMGQPVKIVDLARRMIRLAGLEPEVDVEIVFTGLRPGERLAEALESEGEELHPTNVPGVRSAVSREVDLALLETRVRRLQEAVELHDASAVGAALQVLVADYSPADAQPALPSSADPSGPTGSKPARLRIVSG